MRATPLESRISEIVDPVVTDLGFALVCVKIISDNGSQNVQIMAEDPKTRRLGVDDAAKISRSVAAVMDVEDPINGAYRLEVSSPGIDRPLMQIKDFADYEGFEVKIESDTPAENGQKKFRGRIQSVDGEIIKIDTDQGLAEVSFGTLTKAKLVLTDELIEKTAVS